MFFIEFWNQRLSSAPLYKPLFMTIFTDLHLPPLDPLGAQSLAQQQVAKEVSGNEDKEEVETGQAETRQFPYVDQLLNYQSFESCRQYPRRCHLPVDLSLVD